MTAPLISGFTSTQFGVTADANPVLANAIPNLQVGELALYWVAQRGTGNSPAAPTGWTQIVGTNVSNSIGTTGSIRWFGRIADGTSDDRPSFAIGASSRAYVFHGLRIRGSGVTNVASDIPVANTATVGSTINTPTYDPAAVSSPSGGAKDYLALVGLFAGGNISSSTLTPSSGYTEVGASGGIYEGTSLSIGIVQYRRLENASSEDPGVIAFSGTAISRPYSAATILIPPKRSSALALIRNNNQWVVPTEHTYDGNWDVEDPGIKVRSGGSWV